MIYRYPEITERDVREWAAEPSPPGLSDEIIFDAIDFLDASQKYKSRLFKALMESTADEETREKCRKMLAIG